MGTRSVKNGPWPRRSPYRSISRSPSLEGNGEPEIRIRGHNHPRCSRVNGTLPGFGEALYVGTIGDSDADGGHAGKCTERVRRTVAVERAVGYRGQKLDLSAGRCELDPETRRPHLAAAGECRKEDVMVGRIGHNEYDSGNGLSGVGVRLVSPGPEVLGIAVAAGEETKMGSGDIRREGQVEGNLALGPVGAPGRSLERERCIS